jgi:hypothetical protein
MSPVVAERNMESNVGKLEADVDHIKSRTNAIGTDIRDLRSRVDVVHDSLSRKMDDGFQALSSKMDNGFLAQSSKMDNGFLAQSSKMDRMTRDISGTKVWALLIAAAVLGVMAHALKWL